jgi:hypothetical protein
VWSINSSSRLVSVIRALNLAYRFRTKNRDTDSELVLLCYKMNKFGVELFCGNTPLRARPTAEALRGIYRGSG